MTIRECADAEVAFARSLSRHLRSLYEPTPSLGPLSDLVEQLCETLNRVKGEKLKREKLKQ